MCDMMNLQLIYSFAVNLNDWVHEFSDLLIELLRKLKFIMEFFKFLINDISFVQALYGTLIVLH